MKGGDTDRPECLDSVVLHHLKTAWLDVFPSYLFRDVPSVLGYDLGSGEIEACMFQVDEEGCGSSTLQKLIAHLVHSKKSGGLIDHRIADVVSSQRKLIPLGCKYFAEIFALAAQTKDLEQRSIAHQIEEVSIDGEPRIIEQIANDYRCSFETAKTLVLSGYNPHKFDRRCLVVLDGKSSRISGYGFMDTHKQQSIAQLRHAGVFPEERGNGYYSAVLSARIEACRQNQIASIISHGMKHSSALPLMARGFKHCYSDIYYEFNP